MENKNFNKEEYIDELLKRNAKNSCHRCNNKNFTLLEGFSYFPIQEKINGSLLGGPNVPVILVVCNNCGAVTPHAIGVFNPIENNIKN